MARNYSSVLGSYVLKAGVSAVALAAFPLAAFAEDTAPGGGLEEIVVTAQKREESLQDVPVAVTAVSQEQIDNLQVRSFTNLAGIAPNLSLVSSVSGSDPIINMRGIIGGNATNGTDSAIAMYIDGVYLARTTGASFDVADLQRVEVLRGPQGTLYGKNSTGGAVNFITANPKGELYARLEGTVGNLDRRRVKVRVDTPTFHGFSFSGAYLHDEQDGWVDNLSAGTTWDFSAANRFFKGKRTSPKTLGAFNSEAGFFAAHYEPDDGNVKVDYKFDITSSRKTNQAQQVLVDYVGIVPAAQVSTKRLDAVSMPWTTPEELETFGHSLTVSAQLAEGFTFKSITGYRGSTDSYSNDVAGSGGIVPGAGEFAITNILAYEKTRQFSQEVQFNYLSTRLDLIGGIYYFHERTTSTAPVYIFQFVPFTLPNRTTIVPTVDGDVTANNESLSGYMQATAHITSRLDLTGGIRYTKDSRASDERGAFLGVPNNDFAQDFNRVDWAANLSFRPTDDLTVYVKAGSGYLSGGVFGGFGFKPETVIQYEGGVKADLLDRRLRVNLAAFHTDYKDLQVASFYLLPGSATNSAYYIKNVANAKIDGFEAEVTVVPIEGLTLNGNFGYTNFKYQTAPAGVVNPAYRPKYTAALNLNYKVAEFSNGMKPIIDVNARYTGDQHYLTALGNSVPYATNPAVAKLINDNDNWVVDARLTLADIPLGPSKAKVSVWSKNIFDDRTMTNATDATGGVIVNGQFRQPRTYGVDVGFEF